MIIEDTAENCSAVGTATFFVGMTGCFWKCRDIFTSGQEYQDAADQSSLIFLSKAKHAEMHEGKIC